MCFHCLVLQCSFSLSQLVALPECSCERDESPAASTCCKKIRQHFSFTSPSTGKVLAFSAANKAGVQTQTILWALSNYGFAFC